MTKAKFLSLIPFFSLSLLLSSCNSSINQNTNELYTDGIPFKTNYYVGDKLELADGFHVYDKSSNINIIDYSFYLNNKLEIFDGYVFDIVGTYDVYIRSNGYQDYKIPDYTLVVSEASKSLVADTSNMKLEYHVGEALSFGGLKVYDGFGKEVFDFNINFAFSEGEILKHSGSYLVTISKKGYLSTSFYIKVLEDENLYLDISNIRTIFTIGEKFSYEGLIVKDKNGNEINDYEISLKRGTILNTSGLIDITVSKTHFKDASFQIEVITQKILLLNKKPAKTEYKIGEQINLNDIEIVETPNYDIVEEYDLFLDNQEISPSHIFNESGHFKVEIKKDNYIPTYFEIDVLPAGLEIVSLPTKTEYVVGETFDSTGLKVSDGFNEISDYTLSLENGSLLRHSGEIKIEITKDDYRKTSFLINVKNVKGMKIKNSPKAYYERGDKFTLDGLSLVDNNSLSQILMFDSSIKGGEALNSVGIFDVTLSSNNYPDLTYQIEVSEPLALGETTTFDIYSINDTHGSFTRNDENFESGISYIADYFLDRKSGNNLYLSAGDMWQGGIESNSTKGIIMSEAMNIMGIEAMSIGNHEFDWGVEEIENNLKVMEFPLLGCNIFYKNTNTLIDFLEPYTIIDKNNIKIGIIGGVMEGIGSSIIQSISKDFDYVDPVPLVKDYSDELREKGCDIIIFLVHDGGFEGYSGEPTKYNSLTQISNTSGKRYIDSFIFAHDHLRKEGIYNGVPFVEAGSNGGYIGNISLSIRRNSYDEFEVESSETDIINAYYTCTTSNKEVDSLLNIYSDVIINPNDVIYKFSKSYSSGEFTLIVCQAMMWFVQENRSIFGVDDVYLSTHNYAGIRDGVSKGDFTYADLIKVCPFSNELAVIKINENQANYYGRNSALGTIYNEKADVDENGYYYGVTISYVAMWTDYSGKLYCTDYSLYENYIISDVLGEYLMNAPDLNL